jgi:hypothetical protein
MKARRKQRISAAAALVERQRACLWTQVAQARKTVEEAEESGAPRGTINVLKTALRLMEQSEKLVNEHGEWFLRRKAEHDEWLRLRRRKQKRSTGSEVVAKR